MKEKIKKFMEDHQKAITIAGGAAMAFTYGFIGYQIGVNSKAVRGTKLLFEEIGVQRFLEAYEQTHCMYAHVFSPERMVEFKELDKLAKSAIAFDPSHLTDKVVGLFVVTKP